MKSRSLDNLKKLIKFSSSTGVRVISREGAILEFKENFNWSSKDKYAKSMSAFANNRGGYLIFGIKDKPRDMLGLLSKNFEETDESQITQYMNSVFSPEIDFQKQVFEIRNKKIGALFINPSKNKPVIAIKNDGDIKEGEIYYRYIARSDKIKFPELKYLINNIQDTERKHWMDLFEKISRIGPNNAAIMDTLNGTIEGRGGH